MKLRHFPRSRLPHLAAAALTLAVASAASAAPTYSYADIVDRLVDPRHLAELPEPGETSGQWSSHNRDSQYDEATDTYLNWDANKDGTGRIAQEGEAIVMAEMEGPGVVWRIWTARPQKGHVKIYIDGAEEPVIDMPFRNLFNGEVAPFNHPALNYTSALGHNSYVPIPYQKSCRIVAEEGWGRYFLIGYTTFADGTQVPSFDGSLEPDEADALEQAAQTLRERIGENPLADLDGSETLEKSVTVKPGETKTIAQFDQPRAIMAFRARPEVFDNRAEQIEALRTLSVKMTWDGEGSPAVWSPLGDYFGTGIGQNYYRSLMSGMGVDGYYAYWYMPFEKAKLELTNEGTHERQVDFKITHAPLEQPAGELGRFHAKWHRDAFLPERADRWPDWTVLKTEGRGRFAGMMLHVWNPRAGHNWKWARDGGWWWGEGDEKFFVDGEKFPSWYGTGTEDYFGYAWCRPDLFEKPFHGQTLTQMNKGHQSVFRHQVADNVPFQESFDGYVEKYFPNSYPTRYAAIAYWYLEPGGKDPYGPVAVEDRVGYFDLSDAYEGEMLKVVSLSAGTLHAQTLVENVASGESMFSATSLLLWRGGEPGEELVLAVPVVVPGKYEVRLGMAEAPDYGTVDIHFAGQAPLAPVNLWDDKIKPAEIYLGTFDLDRGDHELSFEITGTDDRGEKAYLVGLDYVKLTPVDEGPDGMPLAAE